MALSVMVNNRNTQQQKIDASLTANSDAVGQGVWGLLSPLLVEGEELTQEQATLFLTLFQRYFTEVTQVMVKADSEHNRELGEDSRARKALEVSGTAAYEALRDLKDAARTAHGEELLEEMQIGGSTPVDPRKDLALINLAMDWMNNPDKALPPSRSLLAPGIDRATVVRVLTPVQKAIARDVKIYDKELRETETTMIAKNDAIARFNLVERAVVDVFSSMMVLVGLTEAASRLRPTTSSSSISGIEDVVENPPGESTTTETPE